MTVMKMARPRPNFAGVDADQGLRQTCLFLQKVVVVWRVIAAFVISVLRLCSQYACEYGEHRVMVRYSLRSRRQSGDFIGETYVAVLCVLASRAACNFSCLKSTDGADGWPWGT